ncbi:AtpZ/AtpI family protein [Janibacter sp. G1551]|uniref:AtpZ/AtpI family protein n=1 Tax=Janibacter sp. G1551 TaxID=3420440 RepID=UPI003CFD19A4
MSDDQDVPQPPRDAYRDAPPRHPEPTGRWSSETEGPSATARADNMGSTVLAYLITGPFLFGGLGYGLDRWLGATWLVAVGILVGMALSLYTIWLRYGTS